MWHDSSMIITGTRSRTKQCSKKIEIQYKNVLITCLNAPPCPPTPDVPGLTLWPSVNYSLVEMMARCVNILILIFPLSQCLYIFHCSTSVGVSVTSFQLGCCIYWLHLTELDSSSFMQFWEAETNTLRFFFFFSLLRKCRKRSSPVAGLLSACPPVFSAVPRMPVSAPLSHCCCQALLAKLYHHKTEKAEG